MGFSGSYDCAGQMSLDDWLASIPAKADGHTVFVPFIEPAPKAGQHADYISDFGEKIEGAKKDLWTGTDVCSMTALARGAIWSKPDYKVLLAEGKPRALVYYIKKAYEAIPKTPNLPDNLTDRARRNAEEKYRTMVNDIRWRVLRMRDIEQTVSMKHFLENSGLATMRGRLYIPDPVYGSFVPLKLVRVFAEPPFFWEREAEAKQFLYTEEEKILSGFRIFCADDVTDILDGADGQRWRCRVAAKGGAYFCYLSRGMESKDVNLAVHTYFVSSRGGDLVLSGFQSREAAKQAVLDTYKSAAEKGAGKRNRKQKYPFPHLEHITRSGGKDYRHGKHVFGDDYLSDFHFRGGQFGNWLGQKERQEVLDMGYDAMMDMAEAVGLTPVRLTGDGKLAIAFGARGSGRALAHFEPLECVINLTRMRGAGSLAHEMIHFLDYLAGRNLGCVSFLSEAPAAKQPASFRSLMRVMKYDGTGGETKFYTDAKYLDGQYAKDKNGYWHSDVELLARAGASYVKDRLKMHGFRDDYLCGHADSVVMEDGKGSRVFGAPQGKERDAIDAAFDVFFSDMAGRGVY